MSPFPSYPYAERFRSYEDAMKFMERADWKLCIPVFVEVDTPNGKKIQINPEYEDAPYEQRVLWEIQSRTLNKR